MQKRGLSYFWYCETGSTRIRIIYVMRPTRIDQIQQKQAFNFLLFPIFNFILWFGRPGLRDPADPNWQNRNFLPKRGPNHLISFFNFILWVTTPTRILKSLIFTQNTRSSLFLVLWNMANPNSESYMWRSLPELKTSSKSKVLIFYLFYFSILFRQFLPGLRDEADPKTKSEFPC